MNRNRRLTVLLLATLALLMLAGCSVLDPLLHPDHEVTGNPDERDTRFVEGSAYHGKDPETRVEPVTDENGEPVTDENGEIVTAVVPVGTETAPFSARSQAEDISRILPKDGAPSFQMSKVTCRLQVDRSGV